MTQIIKNLIRKLAGLRRIVFTWWYTMSAKRKLSSYGTRLKVNGKCLFSGDVRIGNYCNFNGMSVRGGGVKL